MDKQVHPVEAVVKAACEAEGITKAQLCLQLKIGTTTLWRACKGLRIEPLPAKKLCERFPELDFEALTLGDSDAAPNGSSADSSAPHAPEQPA